MKSILTKPNVRDSLSHVLPNMPWDDVKNFSEFIYDYAISCKKREIVFDENYVKDFIDAFARDGTPEVKNDIFALVAMYSFEHMVFSIVAKYNTASAQDAYQECIATITACSQSYDFSKGIKFNTYIFNAMKNNVRRLNRKNMAISIPDYLAKATAKVVEYLSKEGNEDASPETIAAALDLRTKDVENIVGIVRSPMMSLDEDVSEDTPVSLGNIISSDEDIATEMANDDMQDIIETKFLPTIARIYGEHYAYVVFLKTGVLHGYNRIPIAKMEEMFAMYDIVSQKLDEIASTVPQYADICEEIKFAYATRGINGVHNVIHNIPEEYIIKALLDSAEKQAHELCANAYDTLVYKSSKLNYMFNKIFPSKNTLTEHDRRLSARFHKELRELGMDDFVNALHAI